MKKQPASTNKTSPKFSPAHLVVMALGILTAVVCSFVLLKSPSGNKNREENQFKSPALHVINKSIDIPALQVTASMFRSVAKGME